MKALAFTAMLAACAAHDPAMQHQVDAIASQVAELQRQVAELQKQASAPAPATIELESKVDALEQQLARLPSPPSRQSEGPDPKQTYSVVVDGYPSEGPATAKITMVMAFDYADPFSDKNRGVRVELRKKYGNDLRIVYRNFVVHPTTATAAALGGCAAHRQHKFFDYDTVAWEKGFKAHTFDTQDCWTSPAGCPVTTGFAREAKLDLAKFKRDMVACEKAVHDDMADLQGFHVGATPTFFINGRPLIGAQPAETFEALIDDEMRLANMRIANGASAATYYADYVLAQGVRHL